MSHRESCLVSVLLVDDHQMFLDLLEKALSDPSNNIKVIGKVTDGDAALAFCTHHHPQIVLLDINIGTPDGFETASRIRKNSPGTRIIGVSMFTQTAYAKKFLRSGGSGYVTKNSEHGELIEAIHKIRSGDTFLCRQIATTLEIEKSRNAEQVASPAALSMREIEIIQLIRRGNTSKEIAEQLFLTPKTVELHRHNILQKLGLRNTAGLITFAFVNCI